MESVGLEETITCLREHLQRVEKMLRAAQATIHDQDAAIRGLRAQLANRVERDPVLLRPIEKVFSEAGPL